MIMLVCPVGRRLLRRVMVVCATIAQTTIVTLLASTSVPWAAAADPAPCTQGLPPSVTEQAFAALNHPPLESECKLEGVGADRSVLEAKWSYRGEMLPAVRILPRACAPVPGGQGGAFVTEIPAEIARRCPSIIPWVATLTVNLGDELGQGWGGSPDTLFAARVLFVALFGLIAIVMGRAASAGLAPRPVRDTQADTSFRPSRARPSRWLVLGVVSFASAFALRAALPFSLGNWYAEVMPVVGPAPWMRFGPGFFAFQSLLRDLGWWGPQALALSQIAVGAAALPLLLGVLRELHVGWTAAAATLLLLVLAPLHARLSATSSEHVLASTLCLGLLFAWLRAARSGDGLWLALAALLFPLVCITRVDMSASAALVLLWPLLRDPEERRVGLGAGALWRRAGIMGVVASGTCVGVYEVIAKPSHHPMPELDGQIAALRDGLPQLWLLATGEPPWMSLSAISLAAIGVGAMAVRRPWLCARVVATVLLAFVALGRTFLPDELLAARYFLFTIPILLIASGVGFAALLDAVPSAHRAPVAAVGMAVLGAWTALAARSPYAARYTFQDEYSFARQALAQLPDGCAVYQVPIRADELPRDVDCCLDLARSPLIIDFPRLRFLPLPEDPPAVLDPLGCIAYYEGPACEIRDDPKDPSVHAVAAKTIAYFSRRCAQAHELAPWQGLAETTVSPRATVNFFAGKPPRAALYRWTPRDGL